MHDYDIAIIGSGLGGLVCGAILGMHGYKVGVFEKNRQIGGCLQTYSRDKTIIDTGVHYIGGLDKGQQLYQVFKYLGIIDELKLKQLDVDGFDHIAFAGDNNTYPLAQGHDNFIRRLLTYFPNEEAALRAYCDKIKEVCSKFPLYNLRMGDASEKEDVLHISASAFIASITNNTRLRQVLAGNNLLYAGVADKTPFYIHALITNSFIESAWKCVDGGSQIAKLLAKRIGALGGVIQRNRQVTKIVGEGEKVSHIELEDGKKVTARYFISNLHPAQTVKITDSEMVRKAYRSRIEGLKNTTGPFLLNIVLKKNTFPYLNYNYYYHGTDDAWQGIDYAADNWPLTYALFANASSRQGPYTDSLTIMTYMRCEEMAPWMDTFNTDSRPSERGADYELFKQEKAERLIDLAAKKFPKIRDCVQSYYIATPLSYRDYQGSDGSMYGIEKDYRSPVSTFIPTKTKLNNLFLTGQNLNVHGILGVSISAMMTCGALIDLGALTEQIKNA